MFRHLIAISAAIALVSTGGVSLAQSRGGGMSSSGMGGGGSAFGGGGMGGSGFGGGGGFGSGMGSSGMGGGMGQSGFGGAGGSAFGGGQSGFGNSGFGNSSGAGGQQNFVGRDATDMQAAFGQMGNKTATQFMNNMNRSMRSNSSRRSTKKTVQTTTQTARIELKVAFNPPRPPSDQVARDISTRLAKLLAANHMSQPKMNMEGDTVVLRGAAASENERDVISQLLAIEPGVRNVRNEMTIGQPAGAPSGMSPAPGS